MNRLVYRCITTKRLPYTNTRGERISVRVDMFDPKIFSIGKLESEIEVKSLDLSSVSNSYEKLHLAAAKLYLKHIGWDDTLKVASTGYQKAGVYVHTLEESDE